MCLWSNAVLWYDLTLAFWSEFFMSSLYELAINIVVVKFTGDK
ncbi:hypothetical protein DSUL_200006 [Desulfovibrionales bacterium]